nr:hypothetical protein [uncultured Marinifilum sp.]
MLQFLESVLPTMKPEISSKIFNQLLVARFGSRKKAQNEVLKISNNGAIDDDGFQVLLKMIFFEQLQKLLLCFMGGKDYKGLIKSVTQLEELNLFEGLTLNEKRCFLVYLERILSNEFFTQLPIFESKRNSKKQIFNEITNSNITNKDEIAQEIGIDKTTLNKWLFHYFGNRFDGKRKITFEEYIEIMQKFSLGENETKTSIGQNTSAYSDRLENDLVHNRSSLLKEEELEDLNFKSLKDNLVKQEKDSDMKKIPYRLKDKIVKDLS